jgi:diaminopimelate epimerase
LKFEKWQALGNDYLIVERDELPWALTPDRVRRLCDPHLGVGADGVLELRSADRASNVAALRVFNPDGSEAELSGNGAREAILYLRRTGWTDQDTFTLETAAGDVTPTITSASTCRVDMGRASTTSDAYPGGARDGRGSLSAAGREWAFRHVSIGNPQCAIHVETLDRLEGLDIAAIGPAIESHELFPQRTNVSFYVDTGPGSIRARIFERGVGETLSSGTGASGAAIADVLDGGRSPVKVSLDGGELEVEVGEDLRIHLTGWAVPVYRGTLSEELMEELA